MTDTQTQTPIYAAVCEDVGEPPERVDYSHAAFTKRALQRLDVKPGKGRRARSK